MSNVKKSKHGFELTDVSNILNTFGTKKVAYDANIPEVAAIYARYSGGTGNPNSFFSGATDKDIFIYAMCLGKKAGIKNEFVKKKDSNGKMKENPQESIDVAYFARDPEYFWMMLAVALTEMRDPDGEPTLDAFEPNYVLEICQGYANYGIHELIKMETVVGKTDPFKAFDEKLVELLDE